MSFMKKLARPKRKWCSVCGQEMWWKDYEWICRRCANVK